MAIYSFFFLHLFFTSKIYINTVKTKIGISRVFFFIEIQAFEWTAYLYHKHLEYFA